MIRFAAILLLSTQGLVGAAPANATSGALESVPTQAEILARQMVGSPDYTKVLRVAFENAIKTEVAKKDSATDKPMEAALVERLCASTGQLYEAELKASIKVPLDAAASAFQQHLQKYELDRIVEFLSTAAGRKFVSIAFGAAEDVQAGKADAARVGKKLMAAFDEPDQADFAAFAEPSLIAHWKEAVAAYRPASIVWQENIVKRITPKLELLSKRVTKEFYDGEDAE